MLTCNSFLCNNFNRIVQKKTQFPIKLVLNQCFLPLQMLCLMSEFEVRLLESDLSCEQEGISFLLAQRTQNPCSEDLERSPSKSISSAFPAEGSGTVWYKLLV